MAQTQTRKSSRSKGSAHVELALERFDRNAQESSSTRSRSSGSRNGRSTSAGSTRSRSTKSRSGGASAKSRSTASRNGRSNATSMKDNVTNGAQNAAGKVADVAKKGSTALLAGGAAAAGLAATAYVTRRANRRPKVLGISLPKRNGRMPKKMTTTCCPAAVGSRATPRSWPAR